MPTDELPSVCVVTQPVSAAGERISLNLLDIVSAITSVSLLTADVPEDSRLRSSYDVIEVSDSGTGTHVVVAALRFIRNQFRMAAALRRRGEDVVIFFGPTAYLLPILAAKLFGKTVVLQPRGDVPLTLRIQWEDQVPDPVARGLAGTVRLLERVGYRAADAIVTYTPSMAAELDLERYDAKLYTDGARYIDADRFAPRTPLEDRDRAVGFLGRIDQEKGIRTLAAAAKRLPDDVTFRFAGDGELRPWLERELADEIEAGSVESVGWVDHDDVPRELNRLRLLVMPSRPTEGLPTTILEAMACGTPVLSTPVAGVPDVVRPGETGFLIEEREPSALARTITVSLARDDLPGISRNCRELLERSYDFDAAVDRYETILADIAAADR
jgi:glycosyltransferase involved in cell wall biosynthesis